MALPRVGDFQRSMSMSLPTSPNRLENLQQPNPSVNAGPSGPGSVNPQPPQVVQPDPASAPTCSPATARARVSPPTTRSARAATGT